MHDAVMPRDEAHRLLTRLSRHWIHTSNRHASDEERYRDLADAALQAGEELAAIYSAQAEFCREHARTAKQRATHFERLRAAREGK